MTKKKKQNNDGTGLIEKGELKEKSAEEVEINNLQEEIDEILGKCIKCGMCKSLCPVFSILREEAYSPRGKAILLSEKVLDKIVFQCNLCKACEEKCPLKIKVWDAVRKSREILVLKGKELEGNKEMIKNIRGTGNPFGSKADSNKLYCC
jgi:fumarate reductase (CoM/CoB) subunit B